MVCIRSGAALSADDCAVQGNRSSPFRQFQAARSRTNAVANRPTKSSSDSGILKLSCCDYLRRGLGAGPLAVPGPVPIVSPVVPLFIAPLLIPVPGLLGRLAPVAAPLVWLGLAGEIAESPLVVVATVLARCARTNEFEKISAVAAIT